MYSNFSQSWPYIEFPSKDSFFFLQTLYTFYIHIIVPYFLLHLEIISFRAKTLSFLLTKNIPITYTFFFLAYKNIFLITF